MEVILKGVLILLGFFIGLAMGISAILDARGGKINRVNIFYWPATGSPTFRKQPFIFSLIIVSSLAGSVFLLGCAIVAVILILHPI